MDAMHVEKVNTLAKSLYTNRLAASMEEAFDMAQGILGGSKIGEERSVHDLTEEVPEVESLTKEKLQTITPDPQLQPPDPLSSTKGNRLSNGIKIRETMVKDIDGSMVNSIDGSMVNGNDRSKDDQDSNNKEGELNPPIKWEGKMDSLKRILAEEEVRIASLKEDLDKLKAEKKGSAQSSEETAMEVEELSVDIEKSRQELEHIRAHVRDLEDIKHEIRDVEESQEIMDELDQKAQEVKEEFANPPSPPPKPGMPLDEWEDTRTEED